MDISVLEWFVLFVIYLLIEMVIRIKGDDPPLYFKILLEIFIMATFLTLIRFTQ